MTAPTCAYCKETQPLTTFERTEHVIPAAFCAGFSGVLTLAPSLRPAICDRCNQRFGDTLELALGRDSYEAVLRLHHGMKPARDAGDVGQRRLEFTLPEDGKHGPLRVEFCSAPKGDRPLWGGARKANERH